MVPALPAFSEDQSDTDESEDPGEALRLNNEGVAAMNAGEFIEAIDLLRRAAELKPDPAFIQNLSIAMNNLAVKNMSDTKPDQAIALLSQALRLMPSDMLSRNLSEALVMKGRMELKEGRLELAQQVFRDAILVGPKSTEAHLWLAQSLYDDGRLAEALEAVEKAQQLGDRPDLESFAGKIRRELGSEKNFFEHKGMFFRIRYSPDIPTQDVSSGAWALDRAYQEHRMFLGDAPKREIPAVFYSPKDDFAGTHDLTSNVAAIYDGKVRLPVPEHADWEALSRTVSHEVAHAFIFDAGGPGTPLWLNEGLAEFLSTGPDRPLGRLEESIRKSEPLIPIVELSDTLRNFKNNTRVTLAYDQAYSLVKFLNQRFGVFGVRRLLQTFKSGASEEDAVREALFMTPEILQQNWESSLR
ncbi:tetratricopeptide repeat protein [bacterium]|nr:tetratricopeptide repeat protein [bacterium]